MLNIKNEDVENIIREVALTHIIPHFRQLRSHEIHFKSEDNPVTIADSEAEFALKEGLLRLLPGSKVVGEEAFASNPALLELFLGDSPVWTVDPVDGTKAFICGKPCFGVIVALTKQNQTFASWLYDPTSNEFVTAEKGAGAYYKGQRLKVLSPAKLSDMAGVMGSGLIDAFEGCDQTTRTSGPQFERMMSSCHDYARLVVGGPHFSKTLPQIHFHCWKEICTPWDNAAGILIHAEAGGYSAHWNEDPFMPAHFGRGILSAPDKASWLALREWVETFCKLPE